MRGETVVGFGTVEIALLIFGMIGLIVVVDMAVNRWVRYNRARQEQSPVRK
ncbi:hypothetical protein [Mechercharimyces sp. CAU 1602]|uniref:hypothetical protein n=1 Tax=Mechercharimyces sp. CAU 1602 TaxID=2973933 RepID=UPI002163625B|nr:hypothetical protein [Mechercharimyces sp. CAU 1602]MCS1351933.1 hypothetical protein [Mechercharimyces sp. CAU 1602]